MDLLLVGLIISYSMTLYLFIIAYIEAMKICSAEGKVYGGTMIGSFILALVFTRFTYLFYS